jgi:hypothetical protein
MNKHITEEKFKELVNGVQDWPHKYAAALLQWIQELPDVSEDPPAEECSD